MKIYADETASGDVVILMSKKEGQALADALTHATEPPADGKKLSKRSNAWKIASHLSMNLPVW